MNYDQSDTDQDLHDWMNEFFDDVEETEAEISRIQDAKDEADNWAYDRISGN